MEIKAKTIVAVLLVGLVVPFFMVQSRRDKSIITGRDDTDLQVDRKSARRTEKGQLEKDTNSAAPQPSATTSEFEAPPLDQSKGSQAEQPEKDSKAPEQSATTSELDAIPSESTPELHLEQAEGSETKQPQGNSEAPELIAATSVLDATPTAPSGDLHLEQVEGSDKHQPENDSQAFEHSAVTSELDTSVVAPAAELHLEQAEGRKDQQPEKDREAYEQRSSAVTSARKKRAATLELDAAALATNTIPQSDLEHIEDTEKQQPEKGREANEQKSRPVAGARKERATTLGLDATSVAPIPQSDLEQVEGSEKQQPEKDSESPEQNVSDVSTIEVNATITESMSETNSTATKTEIKSSTTVATESKSATSSCSVVVFWPHNFCSHARFKVPCQTASFGSIKSQISGLTQKTLGEVYRYMSEDDCVAATKSQYPAGAREQYPGGQDVNSMLQLVQSDYKFLEDKHSAIPDAWSDHSLEDLLSCQECAVKSTTIQRALALKRNGKSPTFVVTLSASGDVEKAASNVAELEATDDDVASQEKQRANMKHARRQQHINAAF